MLEFFKKKSPDPAADACDYDQKFLDAIKETRSYSLDDLEKIYGGNTTPNYS